MPLLTNMILSVLLYTFGQCTIFYLDEIGTGKRRIGLLLYLGFVVGVTVDAIVRQASIRLLTAECPPNGGTNGFRCGAGGLGVPRRRPQRGQHRCERGLPNALLPQNVTATN